MSEIAYTADDLRRAKMFLGYDEGRHTICSRGCPECLKIIKLAEGLAGVRHEIEKHLYSLIRDARVDETKKLWSLDFTDAYNGGYLTEKGRDYLRKRIAELMEEKETK